MARKSRRNLKKVRTVGQINKKTDLELIEENGQFDRIPLHQKNTHELLSDREITEFMPKSCGNINIMTSIHLGSDGSAELILQQALKELSNPEVKHIVLPFGPGHWQGVYISKPNGSDGTYQVDIFDSMGKASAKSLVNIVDTIMAAAYINQYDVTYSSPTVLQKDGYSCGDFLCAYTHKKMQDFGAPKAAYLPEMITAFNDSNGNQDDVLRNVIRVISAEYDRGAPIKGAHHVADENAAATAKVVEPKLQTNIQPAMFTERQVQQLWTKNADNYGLGGQGALKELINSRQTLFALRHDNSLDKTPDQALAIELQCQEFENAGFKP